jgi:hypothetical protein
MRRRGLVEQAERNAGLRLELAHRRRQSRLMLFGRGLTRHASVIDGNGRMLWRTPQRLGIAHHVGFVQTAAPELKPPI